MQLRGAIGAAALAAAALACGQAQTPGAGTLAGASPTPAGNPTLATQTAHAGMILGVEYASAELAPAFADSGAVSAKPYPDDGDWGSIQSGPQAAYNWRRIDRFVRAHQESGFSHLTLIITARALWAASDPPSLGDPGDFFPRPEYEQAYVAFVQAFVERYDGDGVDDMPGLRFPVTLFGFEPEYSTFWPGTAETYIRLLELAYPALKAANPQAQVMAAGLLMTDVFNGYPSPAEIDRRLTDPDPRIWDKTPADVALLLDHPELFDVVDVHSLGDYTEIPPTIAWLRQQMAARGYDRPIWIGDSFSGVGLNGWGPATCPRRPNSGWLCYPATEADRCRVAATLQALADSNAPDHQAAIDWIHADSAAGIVRRSVVAAGEGLAGINIGNVEDWEPLMLTLGGAGTSPWQGMVDRVLLTRRFQGYRPAYYALQQVAGIVRRYTAVERLPAENPRIYLYRFHLDDGSEVFIAWADTGLWLPGNVMPTVPVAVPVGTDSPVRVEWTVTAGAEPVVETAAPVEGALILDLGQIPAFVWP